MMEWVKVSWDDEIPNWMGKINMFQTTNQSYLWVNDMAVSENGAEPPQRSGKICIFDRQLSAIDADIILNSPFAEGI